MPLQVPIHFASAIALVALLTTACGGKPKDAAAGAPGGQGAASGGAPAGAPGAPRRTASVVLGTADVARVTRGSIEAGIPIAGDLRAIETLSLKSRL